MSVSGPAVALQSSRSRHARASSIMFSVDQHGPDDARGFGGERHHCDLVGSPRQQFAQPRIGYAARLLVAQVRTCSTDQHGSEQAIALFGDVAWTMLAA